MINWIVECWKETRKRFIITINTRNKMRQVLVIHTKYRWLSARTPLLTHWSYCSLALSHRYIQYVKTLLVFLKGHTCNLINTYRYIFITLWPSKYNLHTGQCVKIHNVQDFLFHENAYTNIICRMVTILSRSQCIKSLLAHLSLVPHKCVSELGQQWFR